MYRLPIKPEDSPVPLFKAIRLFSVMGHTNTQRQGSVVRLHSFSSCTRNIRGIQEENVDSKLQALTETNRKRTQQNIGQAKADEYPKSHFLPFNHPHPHPPFPIKNV